MTEPDALPPPIPGFLPSLAPKVQAPKRIWLISFTDFVCLMLSFFVMLYGMTAPDARRDQVLQAIFGGSPAEQHGNGNLDQGKATDLGYLGRVMERQLSSDPALAAVRVIHAGDRLVAALPEEALFAPGATTLSSAGSAILFALGGVVSNVANAVEVVGHTDLNTIGPSPIGPNSVAPGATANAAYPSNWELSLARGRTIALALARAGYAEPITVRGQAGGAGPGTATDADRATADRRIDIVIREYAARDGKPPS
ncbi:MULTISPECIES: OmpA/MotB family protein [Nitrospirillum]|uniref:Chemotaxis protein MotB n=1 Tax=Nitrospirillum amazonense TaxID=28077 RepID=A0A560G9W4_9PROT|nr:flagellar motor protein MotB [Nitrospirillum amazonense]MEC4595292.1 flagellar motor protein MotB [Nitrospirillum amazonense]TWB30682.1 chemotaxis protein MotB [Nitrospirillum amazonense]